MNPTLDDLNEAQRNAAVYGLHPSMPCTRCGHPMKRIIEIRFTHHLGVQRVHKWVCEKCISECPGCMQLNVNCECDKQMELLGAASGLPRHPAQNGM